MVPRNVGVNTSDVEVEMVDSLFKLKHVSRRVLVFTHFSKREEPRHTFLNDPTADCVEETAEGVGVVVVVVWVLLPAKHDL